MATIEARLDAMQAAAHEKVINTPEIVTGLRNLADLVDANPRLAEQLVASSFYIFPNNVDEFALASHDLGGLRKKTADDSWFNVSREFGGGLVVEVCLSRGSACERVVVGSEHIEEAVIPAHDKEIVEWRCPPSLLDFGEGEAV
jgi:hypothetical protein